MHIYNLKSFFFFFWKQTQINLHIKLNRIQLKNQQKYVETIIRSSKYENNVLYIETFLGNIDPQIITLVALLVVDNYFLSFAQQTSRANAATILIIWGYYCQEKYIGDQVMIKFIDLGTNAEIFLVFLG